MVGIADFFTLIQNAGIFHFYLPFVLVFAIFYGLLTKSKVFGDDKMSKRLNAIISLIAALYVVGFSPVGVQLISFADYIGILFTDAAVVIVTLLVFLLILFMLIPTKSQDLSGWWNILIVIAALIGIALFFNAGGGAIFGIFGSFGGGGLGISGQDIAVIVLVIITVFVIYWLTKGEKSEGGGGKQ
jgi:hypothetical protein